MTTSTSERTKNMARSAVFSAIFAVASEFSNQVQLTLYGKTQPELGGTVANVHLYNHEWIESVAHQDLFIDVRVPLLQQNIVLCVRIGQHHVYNHD